MKRVAGLCYIVTFASGITALLARGGGRPVAGAVAALSYVAVTILFYWIFRPGGASTSLVAALISLFAIAAGALRFLPFNTLVLFGIYCLLLARLSSRMPGVPRLLSVLLVCAGVGWLTFALPAFAAAAYPWTLAPGLIGEGALTIWLLSSSRDGADSPSAESSRA